MIKTDYKETLMYLGEHESALRDLYLAFSKVFTANSNFWQWLSKEEEAHRVCVEKLLTLAKDGQIAFRQTSVKPLSIKNSLRYINEIRGKCGDLKFTEKKAAATALDIENTIIERRIFEFIDTANPEAFYSVDKILKETREHQRRLEEHLKKLHQPG